MENIGNKTIEIIKEHPVIIKETKYIEVPDYSKVLESVITERESLSEKRKATTKSIELVNLEVFDQIVTYFTHTLLPFLERGYEYAVKNLPLHNFCRKGMFGKISANSDRKTITINLATTSISDFILEYKWEGFEGQLVPTIQKIPTDSKVITTILTYWKYAKEGLNEEIEEKLQNYNSEFIKEINDNQKCIETIKNFKI